MKHACTFVVAMLASAAAMATGFSGIWLLDQARSANLPPYYSGVKSHRLTNTQNEKQLVVAVEIEGPGPAPQKVSFLYNLDRTPSTSTTEVRTPAGIQQAPTTMAAAMGPDGQLHIAIAREVKQGERVVKGESAEDWSLSPDGQTLTVHMVRQNQGSDLVFTKQ
jgi:hypothetical protein